MSASRIKASYPVLLMFGFLSVLGLLAIQFQDDIWPQPDQDWEYYKTQFVEASGRVVDTGNQNVSHSEGQSWGLILSTHFDDQKTFDQIWQWTQTHLQIRDDALLAWRWLPEPNEEGLQVPDQNNASDADLYTAWALINAHQRWGDQTYADDAENILKSIKTKLINHYADQTVLLPGTEGFVRDDHLILNLSYWVFPALQKINEFDTDPIWSSLIKSGLTLLDQARFGQWNLPADWITLKENKQLSPSEDFPARFSYDAIRIPLSLSWYKYSASHDLLKPYIHWHDHALTKEMTPAWVDLSDNSVAPYKAPEGFQDVFSLTRQFIASGSDHIKETNNSNDQFRLSPDQDYYSASLTLLSRLAYSEIASP